MRDGNKRESKRANAAHPVQAGGRPSRRWARPLVIAIALCVIAFSAWSLAQYSQGADPLGWLLSQDALQTTADTSSGDSSNNNLGEAATGSSDAQATTADDGSATSANETASQSEGEDAGESSGQAATQDDAASTAAADASPSATTQPDAGTTAPQSGSVGSSGSAASTSGSSASGQPSTTQQAQTISVTVTVDGSPAGGSRHASTVELSPGSNVYDALVAADGNVNARDTVYGTYVAAIDGLAEKEHGSMSGWVYAVNGVEPNTACSNYVLSSGDVVVWTYVNVE